MHKPSCQEHQIQHPNEISHKDFQSSEDVLPAVHGQDMSLLHPKAQSLPARSRSLKYKHRGRLTTLQTKNVLRDPQLEFESNDSKRPVA